MLEGEVLDSASPLIDLNGQIPLNRIDDQGVVWIATGVTGWGGPGSTTSASNRNGADGGWRTQGFRSYKEIAITGILIAESASGAVIALDRLNEAIAVEDFFIHFDEHGVQRYMTVCRGGEIDVDHKINRVTFSLSLIAVDPFKYSGVLNFETANLLSITGGLSIPSGGLTAPLSINATITTNEAICMNSGNKAADTIIKVYGPAAFPLITNEATNKRMRYSRALSASEVLTIDSAKKSVTVNGVDRNASVSGDFIQLARGANTLRYQADAYESASHMDITWRDRWE